MKIQEIIALAKESWLIIAGVLSAIGGYLTYRRNKLKSTDMLYGELEKLKQLVILKTRTEVEQATTIAEKTLILNKLKTHCPECYEEAVKDLNI